eukprot:COSAG01_NODE_50_length_31487_cov_90.470243_24_plen_234_part_00
MPAYPRALEWRWGGEDLMLACSRQINSQRHSSATVAAQMRETRAAPASHDQQKLGSLTMCWRTYGSSGAQSTRSTALTRPCPFASPVHCRSHGGPWEDIGGAGATPQPASQQAIAGYVSPIGTCLCSHKRPDSRHTQHRGEPIFAVCFSAFRWLAAAASACLLRRLYCAFGNLVRYGTGTLRINAPVLFESLLVGAEVDRQRRENEDYTRDRSELLGISVVYCVARISAGISA